MDKIRKVDRRKSVRDIHQQLLTGFCEEVVKIMLQLKEGTERWKRKRRMP